MGEVLEVVKTLVLPTEKLIGAVQNAIGTIYEPSHIRKMADAKAYEIDKIGQAIRRSSDIPIVYDKGSVGMDTTEVDSFVKRTQSRLAYQELAKQNNIERVVDITYSLLEKEPEISNEAIDTDWLLRFFNDVEDISDETMQVLWAKVLAGEVKQPRSVSLRTLNVLKNLSQHEAADFKKLIPFILRAHGNSAKDCEDYFILHKLIYEYGFEYSLIEVVSDAGLMFANSHLETSIYINPREAEWIIGIKNKIRFCNNSQSQIILGTGAYMLTQAGKELFKVAFDNDIEDVPPGYMEKCLIDLLNSTNPDVISADILPL